MTYFDLLIGFLKVGFFALGGAYGAIPLIRDVVMFYGWMSDEMLTYIIAVSESTPGPIMVNLATYVGSVQGGLPGALIATTAVVLPSFFVVILVTAAMKAVLENKYVKALLEGMEPCVVGIVLATGGYMTVTNCIVSVTSPQINGRVLAITAILVTVKLAYRKLAGKKLSPIMLIAVSSLVGAIVYGI